MNVETAYELVRTGEWTVEQLREWIWSLTDRAHDIGWRYGQTKVGRKELCTLNQI